MADFTEQEHKELEKLFKELQDAQWRFSEEDMRKAYRAIGDIIHANCVRETEIKCRKREGRGWISMYTYHGERRD